LYPNPRAPVDTISCRRCAKNAPKLEKPPFRNELGDRIQQEICQECWGEWLQHQTVLINHYGLDPRTPRSREFLYQQIETVLLKGEEGEQVDTSQKGSIEF
jgi:Fe-S cluster biosynthesis and repair protein YggX